MSRYACVCHCSRVLLPNSTRSHSSLSGLRVNFGLPKTWESRTFHSILKSKPQIKRNGTEGVFHLVAAGASGKDRGQSHPDSIRCRPPTRALVWKATRPIEKGKNICAFFTFMHRARAGS